MSHAGWKVERRETTSGFNSYEVFTSPEGVEYRRAKDPSIATVVISDWKTRGLPPLYLKPLKGAMPAAALAGLAAHRAAVAATAALAAPVLGDAALETERAADDGSPSLAQGVDERHCLGAAADGLP